MGVFDAHDQVAQAFNAWNSDMEALEIARGLDSGGAKAQMPQEVLDALRGSGYERGGSWQRMPDDRWAWRVWSGDDEFFGISPTEEDRRMPMHGAQLLLAERARARRDKESCDHDWPPPGDSAVGTKEQR